jgi:hypothetical protein
VVDAAAVVVVVVIVVLMTVFDLGAFSVVGTVVGIVALRRRVSVMARGEASIARCPR